MEKSAPARPLWDRIQEVIAERGWTMSRLERESGISRKTIGNWKSQPRTPQSASVNAVADALSIDRATALQLAGILTRDEERGLKDLSDEELKARLDELGSELARRQVKDESRGPGENREII